MAGEKFGNLMPPSIQDFCVPSPKEMEREFQQIEEENHLDQMNQPPEGFVDQDWDGFS